MLRNPDLRGLTHLQKLLMGLMVLEPTRSITPLMLKHHGFNIRTMWALQRRGIAAYSLTSHRYELNLIDDCVSRAARQFVQEMNI